METNLNSLFAKWDERKEFDGYHNGYAYIDLGLPSGTKWATCNVGADLTNPDGLLFQHGRADGYKYDDTNNNFTSAAENEIITDNARINLTTSKIEYSLGQTLSLTDDAAHINMGGDWIMPARDDLQELYDNTTKQVTIVEAKLGMLLTSKINGKSIFIPFSGFYDCFDDEFCGNSKYGTLWSSSIDLDSNILASRFYFDICEHCYIDGDARACGYSVRGVLK